MEDEEFEVGDEHDFEVEIETDRFLNVSLSARSSANLTLSRVQTLL